MSTPRRRLRGRLSTLLGAAVIVGGLVIPTAANAVSAQTLVLTTGWDSPHNAKWSGGSGTFTLTLTRATNEACFSSTFESTSVVANPQVDPLPTSTAINDARALADPATVIEFPISDSAFAYAPTGNPNEFHAGGCRSDVSTATIDDIFAQAGTQAEDGSYVAVIYDQNGVVGIGGFLDQSYATSNVTISTKLCPNTIQSTSDLTGNESSCTATTTGFSYLVTDGVNLHSTNANATADGNNLIFKDAAKAGGSSVNVKVTVPGSNRFGTAKGGDVSSVSSTDFDVNTSGGDTSATVYIFRPPADTTNPTVSKPVVNFTTNVRYGPGGAKMRVSWTGADTAAVASYEIQRSLDGGAYTSLGTGLTSTFFDTAMSNGHKYRFRVQATDDANNKSAWSYSDSSTLRVVQDFSSSIKYTGTWGTGHSSTAASGTTHFASTAGRTAKLSFTGRAIAFVAPEVPTHGKAKIYLDGKYKTTVDTGGTLVPRNVQYNARWSSAGSHSITISVVGTSGRPRVDVDAFMYLQ